MHLSTARLRRAFCCYVVPGAWLVFAVIVASILIDGGASHRVLMPTLVIGGLLCTALLILAAWWSLLAKLRRPPGEPVQRRRMRVGGRELDYHVVDRSLPVPVPVGPRLVPRRPDPMDRTQPIGSRDPRFPVSPPDVATVEQPVTARAVDGRPVALAERDDEVKPTDPTKYFMGYSVGRSGESMGRQDDDATRGFVAGALDRERAGDDEPDED